MVPSRSQVGVLSAYAGHPVHHRVRPRARGCASDLHDPAAGAGPLPGRDRARLLRARTWLGRDLEIGTARIISFVGFGMLLLAVRRRAVPGRPVRDGLAVRDGDRDRARPRAGHRILRDGAGGRADAGGGRHRGDRRGLRGARLRALQGPRALDAAAVAGRVRGLRRDDRLVARRRRGLAVGERADLPALGGADRRRLQLPAQARDGGRLDLARDRDLRLDRQHLRLTPQHLPSSSRGVLLGHHAHPGESRRARPPSCAVRRSSPTATTRARSTSSSSTRRRAR